MNFKQFENNNNQVTLFYSETNHDKTMTTVVG